MRERMSIVLPHGRPAIDVVRGSYDPPEAPWSHLGDPEPRARLQAAIASVGRVDYVGHPTMSWGGTAFVVGPGLLMTQSLGLILQRDGEGYAFNAGQSAVVDFGHERWPSESLRVGIEEVIYVDPHWKVELVKATLPDTIIPLSLSVLNPDELENRPAETEEGLREGRAVLVGAPLAARLDAVHAQRFDRPIRVR